MPDLLNLLEYKKNTRVLVNGTVYKIGPDGVVNGVNDRDAHKLLQNERVWKIYDPKKAAELRAQAKAAAKGRMQLIGAEGPIPKNDKPGDPMDPNVEVYKRPDPMPKKVPENPPQAALETADTEQAESEAEPDGEPPQQAISEPSAEAEDASGEWPDPDESMDIGYLREMAEAYEVTFNSRTPKKTLVKRISAAMYE